LNGFDVCIVILNDQELFDFSQHSLPYNRCCWQQFKLEFAFWHFGRDELLLIRGSLGGMLPSSQRQKNADERELSPTDSPNAER
jgi:hypothetical protein